MSSKHPPTHLGKAGRAFWKATVEEFDFVTAADWSLLEQASGCLDRISEARAAIAGHGLLIPTGQGGLKPNPAANIERDNRILFSRLCRELRLAEPPKEERPPRIGGRC